MTAEEFDNTAFIGGMRCLYKNKVYDIQIVDFLERLVAIDEVGGAEESGELSWKRCENIELI